MSTEPKPRPAPGTSSAARTRAYRARLRAQGLKPHTIWAHDMSSPVFMARLKSDVERLKNDPAEAEMMDWLEACQVEDGLWG